MSKSTFKTEVEVQNTEAKAKIEELKNRVKELDAQCKILGKNAKASAKGAGDAFKMWGDGLKDANTFVGKFQRGISSIAGGPLNNLASSMGMNVAGLAKFGTGIGAAVAAGEALIDFTKQAVASSAQFGKSMTELSAITGVSGKDLESLRTMIQNLAKDTNTSSTEVSGNFAQIGSALPQLLKDAEGLKSVSSSAITLSKAGIMPLAEATDSLTATMAQFNISADDAASVTDILANSAQLGSAGISDVAASLKVCGTAANMAGIGLKDTAAMAEVLASKGLKGAEAGTKLRNVFTKMSTSGIDQMNPKIVGLSKALEYLKSKANDAQFMVKTFGAENMSAASILATNISMFDQLSDGLGNVGTAADMAAQNTNNLASDWADLGVQWENLLSSFNVDGENNPLRGAVQEITNIVKAVNELFSTFSSGDSVLSEAFTDLNLDPLRDLLGIITDLIKFYTDYSKANKDTAKSMSLFEAQLIAVSEIIKVVRELLWWIETGILSLKKVVGEVTEKWDNFKSSISASIELPSWMKKLKEWADKLWDSLKSLIDIYREFKGTANDYARGDNKEPEAPKKTTTTQTTPEPTPTPDPNKTTKTKGSKSESPLEKYNREIAASAAAYKANLIKEDEYLQKQISATQSYIQALEKDKSSIEKNKSTIEKLNSKVDDFKNKLAAVKFKKNFTEGTENAIKKLKDGVLSMDEFNTKYRDQLVQFIDEYYKLDNISEEQRNEQKKFIEKLKKFDTEKLKYEQQKAKQEDDNYLKDTIRTLKDIIKGDKVSGAFKAARQQFKQKNTLLDTYEADKEYQKKILGVEFKIEDFDKSWFEKYQDELKKAGLKVEEPGKLFTQIKKSIEIGNPDVKFKAFEVDDSDKWKGDKSNFAINQKSNNRLVNDNTFVNKKDNSLAGQEQELNKLLNLHKAIEDEIVKEQERQIASGKTLEQVMKDNTFKDYEKALGEIGGEIDKLGEKIKNKLNIQMKLQGVDESLRALQSVGSTVQVWSKMGETIANAENGFDAFMSVFSAGIQTFETVVGLIDSYNNIMTLFSGVSSATQATEAAKTVTLTDEAAATTAAATATGTLAVAEEGLGTATATALSTEAGAASAAVAPLLAATAALQNYTAAQNTAAYAAIPFVGAGAASVAQGIYTGLWTAAKTFSKTVAFANGGIVPGTSFSGDNVSARLNSGEMVLNTHQQRNLFNALDNGFAMSAGNAEVKFKIEGKQLVGVLNNYNTSKSKLR